MYVIFISYVPLPFPNPAGSFRLWENLSDYAHVYKLLVIYYFMEFLLVFFFLGMGWVSLPGRFISYAVWCTSLVNY